MDSAKLASIPIFDSLPSDIVARITALATEVAYPSGTVLINAHAPGSGLYVIEEGSVIVETPRITVERGAGEVFGEISLLTDRPSSGRVRAKTAVKCLAISRQHFRKLLESEPRLALALLEMLAGRLADTVT